MSEPKDAAARVADNVAFAILQNEVEGLRTEVGELKEDIKELVEAWRAAGALVKFVKLAATIIGSIGAIYIVFRHGFSRVP